MKKIFSLTLFLAVIVLGYLYKDLFLAWIHAGGILSAAVSMLFVAILVFFPVMPFIAVAGIIGAVFGTWEGAVISLSGALLGTMLMFFLSRYGFRDWAQHYLQKYPKAKEYESYFEKNAFLGILFVRLVPVVPAPVVNILCGISWVAWPTFFLASLLGKMPTILIFTFAGSRFVSDKWLSLLIYGGYFLVIMLLSSLYMRKKQGKEMEEATK